VQILENLVRHVLAFRLEGIIYFDLKVKKNFTKYEIWSAQYNRNSLKYISFSYVSPTKKYQVQVQLSPKKCEKMRYVFEILTKT